MYQFDRKEYEKRMEWYQDARFGMFIHWGLYSIPARGEWVRSVEEIPEEEYLPFMKEFDARDYNPKQWAKEAKAAGMKYVVLTAKHHDGFCLFDSKYTDYKVTNTPAGRDLIKEYVEALREEGLKVGIYFTLLDWHHPDYPHYGDRIHPMRNHKECGNENRDFSRYTEYLYNQVEEICTNYGQIDIIWFDFSYDDMRGEKWGATKLINMVRSLQPQVIIDNRLEASGEGRGSLYECDPTPYHVWISEIMLQNSVDYLRLLCYDADVPKRTCCTGGNKTRRGLPPLPERRDALEKITAERVLAELAELAFADLGADPAPPVKVGDKLRALELIYKYLGLGDGAAAEEPVVIVDEAPTEQEVTP